MLAHVFRAANFASENRLLAYGIAIAIFVIATILRVVLDPYVLPPAPFVTYYPAVLLTAFLCGLWPAVFTIVISGIHELTTNALKYGALSAPTGGVRIAWSVSSNGHGRDLTFRWEEHGGPRVAMPAREGFGSSLLKAAFEKTRMDYAPDGFCCEIEAHVANSR